MSGEDLAIEKHNALQTALGKRAGRLQAAQYDALIAAQYDTPEALLDASEGRLEKVLKVAGAVDAVLAWQKETKQGQLLRKSMLKADVNEGIQARMDSGMCILRTQTVNELLTLAAEKGFLLLKAPPRSGKTSLLQLLEQTQQQGDVLTINMTDRVNMTWEDFFESQTKQCWSNFRLSGSGTSSATTKDGAILLLIDELQYAYPTAQQQSTGADPCDQLWTYIKRLAAGDARARLMPLRIVAAAVYGDAPSYGSASTGLLRSSAATPFEVGLDRQVRLHRSEPHHLALAYTAAEYEELWGVIWHGRDVELFSGTATKQDILWVTAGQPGLVAFILDHLQQSVKDHSRRLGMQVEYLGDRLYQDMFRTKRMYAALSATRSFLSLQEVSEDANKQWRLLRPLLEAGFGVEGDPQGAKVDSLLAEDRVILAKCLRNGYLISHYHPVQGELYSCNTPLHLYYLQDQLLCARPRQVLQGPQSLEVFIQVIIARLSPQRLHQTLSVGVSATGGGGASAGGVILERKLQMELHAAALSLVPGNWNVCPDVGKVYGSTGLVDMWVSNPDGGVQWALEFLKNGSDLREHERRFELGGKYHNLPHTEFAVIDFRTPNSPRPGARPGQHATRFVLFEEGYKKAKMLRAHDMSLIWGPDILLGDSAL